MKTQFDIFSKTDKTVLILFVVMIFMGWLNIFSAEISESHRNIFDISQNYGKQLLWIITALVIGTVILMFDAKFFMAFSWVIYVFVIFSLVAVLFLGTEINASKSWFRIGGFALQPAEFAKYATALALARLLGDQKGRVPSFDLKVKAMAVIGIPVAMIFLQNDTGSALIFSTFIFVLYREGYISGMLLIIAATAVFLFILTLLMNEFIIIGVLAGITMIIAYRVKKRRRDLIQVMALFAVMSVYVYFVDYTYENVLQPHQKSRIEVLINEEVDLRGAGYNLHQSKIAIGSGGFWGKGYLKGTQTKYNFVPEQGTDFIFCTIG